MCSVRQGLNPATLIAPLATMIAPAASGCARTCRFAHAETACAKPMHNKDFGRTDSEGFSAHWEPSRTPAAHARWRPASWSRLCEVLDRILAGVQDPMVVHSPSTVRSAALRRSAFSLAKAFSIGLKSGEYGGR